MIITQHSKRLTNYICFLDILGFKDFINNNDHNQVELIFSALNNILIDTANGKNSDDSGVYNIESLFISDSIILWTRNTDFESFENLVVVTNWILGISMGLGLPMRGAMASGEISVYSNDNNTTIFGKPLTEAYLMEIRQQWSGCIIMDSCFEALYNAPAKHKRNKEQITKYFSKDISMYKVPLKDGVIREYNVLNWIPDIPDQQFDETKLKEVFSWYNKKSDDWKVETIVQNTIEFYRKFRNVT